MTYNLCGHLNLTAFDFRGKQQKWLLLLKTRVSHFWTTTFCRISSKGRVKDRNICMYYECSRSIKTSCYFCVFGRDVNGFALFFRACFAKMELVIDLKIDNKSSSYRNVITDFGYFKKITGESVRTVGSICSFEKKYSHNSILHPISC